MLNVLRLRSKCLFWLRKWNHFDILLNTHADSISFFCKAHSAEAIESNNKKFTALRK